MSFQLISQEFTSLFNYSSFAFFDLQQETVHKKLDCREVGISCTFITGNKEKQAVEFTYAWTGLLLKINCDIEYVNREHADEILSWQKSMAKLLILFHSKQTVSPPSHLSFHSAIFIFSVKECISLNTIVYIFKMLKPRFMKMINQTQMHLP